MFGSKEEKEEETTFENKIESPDSNITVVGNSVKLEGDLVSKNDINVHGEVVGKIRTEQRLNLGEGSVIKGNAEGENIIIAGKIEGDMVAKEKIEIESTGKVFGNITTKLISIAEGAIFTGQCEMSEVVEDNSLKENSNEIQDQDTNEINEE